MELSILPKKPSIPILLGYTVIVYFMVMWMMAELAAFNLANVLITRVLTYGGASLVALVFFISLELSYSSRRAVRYFSTAMLIFLATLIVLLALGVIIFSIIYYMRSG
ncbi:MAG: hypothetical protein ACI9QL_002190 [Candidatus Omnitrophota bacterium]|jgi:hypothetical protein